MTDESGRYYPLKMCLVEEEICGAISDLLDKEQRKMKRLSDRKLPPEADGQL